MFAFLQDRWQRWSRHNSYARNLAVLTSASAGGQILIVCSAPFLTRLYRPAEFGLLGIFVSIVTILQFSGMLAYHRAIPLPEHDDDAVGVLWLALLVLTAVAGLVACTIPWLDAPLRLMRAESLRPYLWVVPLAVWCAGLYEILGSWTIRQRDFTTFARTKWRQAVGLIAAQLGLGWLGFGAPGLLIGDTLGRSLGIGSLFRPIWRNHRHVFFQTGPRRLARLLYRYRRFPLLQLPALLLTQFGFAVPSLLVAACYGPEAAGILLMSEKVVQGPLTIVGRSVARVYLGEASALARTDPSRLPQLAFSTFRNLALVGTLPTLVLALCGPTVFGWVFGPAWSEAGLYSQWLALPMLMQFAVAPLIQTWIVTEQQHWSFLWSLLRVVLTGAAVAGASRAGWSVHTAIALYAAAVFVVYAAGYVALRGTLRIPACPSAVVPAEPRLAA